MAAACRSVGYGNLFMLKVSCDLGACDSDKVVQFKLSSKTKEILVCKSNFRNVLSGANVTVNELEFSLERQYVPSGYSATSSTITSYSKIYASPIYVSVPVSPPSQINQPEPVERLDSKERVSQLEDL
ncbi:hypothetical protein DAPPUDRAFT_235672 [Daphnia pulex]|uniref:Uncharacterized protein n=1 Tax=Daphnia pulex TaxID=6669 RepID=E9G0I1_DAPPU|nr:hypothetical protein DAPPUDRAFT_235672 [Daphnia pulex]|eukprot:EFX86907.1 hypothetical protein DAPPUDRAFT_235672 [Daphnia pulex]